MYDVDLWLVPIRGNFNYKDAAAYWNAKETRFDDVIAKTPGFFLGVTETFYAGEPGKPP